MEPLLQRILNILIAPPGNLVFHLVLAFSVLASLQAVLITRQAGVYPRAGRLVWGLGMLLAGQMILFLSSGLAWQGLLNPHLFLPPLDRAVFVFSLVWIVWLWCFHKPARLADLVTGFLSLITLILFLFTYSSWSVQGASASFNNHWTDWVWELAAFIVVLTGMGILLFSRPPGWGFGVGMLGLSLAGVVGHVLLTPAAGDFSGILRLSQLAAFPLLPNLLRHLPAAAAVERPAAARGAPITAVPVTVVHPAAPSVPVERRRYSSDPRTVRAFLELKENDSPESITYLIARAMGHSLFADLTFVAMLDRYDHVILFDGYDLIREDKIAGAAIHTSQAPALAGALQRGKSLRLIQPESQPADLGVLGSALGLKEPGTLLMVPLIRRGGTPWGGLLLLSPYSNRAWSPEDLAFITTEAERITQILINAQDQAQAAEVQPMATQPSDLDTGQAAEQYVLQAEIAQLRAANENLADALEEARGALDEAQQRQRSAAPSPELDALVALQKESQEIIAALQSENEQFRAALSAQPGPNAQPTRLEADLRATLKEMAHLQNQLAAANARILMFERQAALTGLEAPENRALLVSLVQDLRQPMASISGYTDLLLSESVGILGALQQKFLERVQVSTERMRSMMDDLIRMVVTGKGQVDLLPKPVELGEVIDSAMLDTSAQLREKNITLRVDLPRDMPRLHADRDALQQILVHLLQNAGAVTPPEGTITLRARVRTEAGEDYLLVQVSDTGGGIQPENLARVFSPRYRAENPLIQGVGDTGIGLAVAKALVEAHGGRIWAESDSGRSSTFSVLLPVSNSPVEASVE